MVRLAIGSPLRDLLSVARSRAKRGQAELPLEGPSSGEELLVIPGWRVNAEGLRMDLVDGNVDVLVICVVVTHRDVLVIGKPQSLHEVLHNTPELVPVEASVFGIKSDDEVIGTVAAGAGVLRVHRLDELAGELQVVRLGHTRKIGGQEPGRPRLVASTPNVASELTKAPVVSRSTLVPNDHR
jgi:hypothetical protein